MFKNRFRIVVVFVILCVPLAAQDAPQVDQPEVTVIVTAERAAQPVSESISSATVITAKQIRESGAQTAADALKLAPGVSISQNGQTGSLANAHLRGTSSAQVLVLVDGQRISSSAFGSTADLSKIPVSDIGRIEVIRGPVSSLYGSDAIGGVINIITKRPTRRAGNVTLGFGGNDRQARGLMLGDGNERSGWQLNADFPAFGGTRPNSDYSATDLSGKLWFASLKGWELSFGADDYHDTLGLPGSLIFGPSLNDRQWWDRSSFDVSAKHRLGPGQLELQAYTVGQTLRQLNPDWLMNSNITGKTTALTAVYRLTRGAHEWTLGGEYRSEDYRDIENGSVEADRGISTRALFAQDRIGLSKTTDVLLGARMDDHSTSGSRVTPRLGINHAVSDKTRVRLSYSEGFRVPSLVELYYHNTSWGMNGNPNLHPESSRQYELGVNTQVGKDTLDAALFTNTVENQIRWDFVANTFMNVDKARQRGIEITWDHPFTSGTRVSMFYTYLDARNLTDGSRLSGIPYNQIGMTLTSRMRQLNMALTGRWTTDRTYGTAVSPGRAVFDLTLVHQTDKPVSPYLTIRNLTNTAYEEVAGYPGEGRSFELGARSNW